LLCDVEIIQNILFDIDKTVETDALTLKSTSPLTTASNGEDVIRKSLSGLFGYGFRHH